MMSDKEKHKLPFSLLGNQLKRLREKHQESILEVSGAVEIDMDALTSYENGNLRPSEDILLLMISHFNIPEDEAAKLWNLAGYGQLASLHNKSANDEDMSKTSIMVMPMDARIIYTDMVHVMVNNYGVVLNFMQGAGPNNQPLAVSRIGMSKEHARSVLEILQKTLLNVDQPPKSLPAPDSK